jgi:hypothetical protein
MKALNAITFGITIFLVSTAAFSADLEWNYNGQAIAKGLANPPLPAGCDSTVPGDTDFIVAGNEISVVFSGMFVQLNEPSSPYQGSKNCHIIIPARLAEGVSLGELDQDLHYSILKDKDTTASVGTRGQFYGRLVSSITVVKGRETEEDGTPQTASADTTEFHGCTGNEPREGNLVIDVTTAAKRTADRFVSTFVPGYDAQFTAKATCYPCTLH